VKIEDLPVSELVRSMVTENRRVIEAVEGQAKQIEEAVNYYVEAIKRGGKVVYFGAGTSGRIGFMDAVELYPTFGVGKETVVPLIAGGIRALASAVEGAEDDLAAADADFESLGANSNYLFIGLSASGTTPYVIRIMQRAKEIGAKTVAITSTPASTVTAIADLSITLDVGEEFVKGSTRLKAGTAEKIVLNTISTISMMKLGKTEKGLMKSLVPMNSKLRKRAVNVIVALTGRSPEEAMAALEKHGWDVERAIGELEKRT